MHPHAKPQPKKRTFALAAAASLALTLSGCTGMPNMPGSPATTASAGGDDGACSINQMAVGAALGAGGGAILGNILGHGSAAGTIFGALGGGALGGFLGNEQDQRCQAAAQAAALQQAQEYADAHASELPVETAQEAREPDPVVYVHHKKHYARPPIKPLAPQTYTNSKTGTSGSAVAMTPYIDKVSGNECTNIQQTATKNDGTTQTAIVTKCRTPPSGPWETVAS